MSGERGGGAVSVPVTILILAMAVVAGLAVDGARAAQGLADADALAGEAARTAGQFLDPVALAGGRIAVDPDTAVPAAAGYLRTAGADGTTEILGPDRVRVTATLTRPTVFLSLIGIDTITSHGSGEAVVHAVGPDGAQP